MQVLFFVLLATVSSVFLSMSYKKGTDRSVDSVSSPALLCSIACFLAMSFFVIATLIANGNLHFANKMSLVYAAILGVCYSLAAYFYLGALSCGPYTISVIFLNASNFMPILYSNIFLKETISTAQIAGLILMLASCIMLTLLRSKSVASARVTPRWVVYITLTFLSNSLLSFSTRLNTTRAPETGTLPFFAAAFFVAFTTCFILFVVSGGLKKKISPRPLFTPGIGIASMLSLNLLPSAELPKFLTAAAQYPLVNGSSIIVNALIGRIFFKERLAFWSYVCIAVTIGSMFLLGL